MVNIVSVRELPVAISRYSDRSIPSGGLTTSVAVVTTDVFRNGEPLIGLGFSSIGRFPQSGLIRERFAPRLLRAAADELCASDGSNIDPGQRDAGVCYRRRGARHRCTR